MEQKNTNAYENRVLTIPNVMSVVRIALIPIMVWLYGEVKKPALAGYALILSGLTDVADGFIARRFHMVSNVGKVLDPLADKLTQGVMLMCLLVRFPLMIAPLILLIIKETFMSVTGYAIIRKTGVVLGADWHGKAATCMLYAAMFLHMLWDDMPARLSEAMIAGCVVTILLSLILYAMRNMKALRGEGGGS